MMVPPKPFVSDGCSGFMSFLWHAFTQHAPPWEGLCLSHDRSYWQGGDTKLRLVTDTKLMTGVAQQGRPYWAMIIFLGVRIGGPWWLPFPSVRRVDGKWKFEFDGVRWGYGYPYPRYK
jgi:hypothetical protein